MAMSLMVNGVQAAIDVAAGGSLLTVLRDQLGLTGAKPGCGEGACGACTVLVDGVATRSCVTVAADVAGRAVTTVEGLAVGSRLHPVQQAFAEIGALQCGYCTPGMVLATVALLDAEPHPDQAAVVAALQGNVCRCGAYPRILRAIQRAADLAAAPEPATSSTVAAGVSAGDSVAGVADVTAGQARARVDALVATRPGPPWDLCAPGERDWFELLGDGVIAVAEGEDAAAWLHLGANGNATVFTGKVELGQGTRNALARLAAQGLGCSISAVQVVMGDTDLCPWDMGTFGSRSMPLVGPAVSAAAAAAAAEPAVRTALVGRRVPAALAGQRLIVTAAVIDGPTLDGPAADAGGEAIRHAPGRVEAVTGSRQFPSDLTRPGRLIGRVLRPPTRGAALRSVDTSGARAMPGVTVVHDGDFVGVVASDRDTADGALAAIRAEWDEPAHVPIGDLETYLRAHPIDRRGWGGAVSDVLGEPDAVFARAPLQLAATYRTAFLAHVPLETRVVLAEWDAGRLTAWTGTQTPFAARRQVADALHLPETAVRVIVPTTGGGFGGKHTGDLVVETARLAEAAGRPVEVRWSRAEEFRGGHFRPAAVVDVRTACADGAVVGLEIVDLNAGGAGLACPYEIAHRRQVFQPTESPLPQGPYRALAATANTFARESHLDEVAHAMGADPLTLRRTHLTDPRLRAVLEAAAERFGWAERPRRTGHGSGLALGLEKGGRVATCVEVLVDVEGRVQVGRVVTAFECGAVVDPDNLANQVEGATMMGLGGALFEQVLFDEGTVLNASFGSYRVPRLRDVPAIDIVLLDRPDLPSAGGGETPIIALAPALANAVFAATGRRIRDLPLAPGGVLRPADPVRQ